MNNDIERPPRGYTTTDVETLRALDGRTHTRRRIVRGVLILVALIAALALLLATGLLQR